MYVLLLVSSIILLIIAFMFSKGDLFSPSVLMMSGYVICGLFAVFSDIHNDGTLSIWTVCSFMTGWAAFIFVEVYINYIQEHKNSIRLLKPQTLYTYKCDSIIWLVFVVINIVITILLYREIVRIGGHSESVSVEYNSVIYAYKQNIDDLPLNGVVKQLLKITKGSGYVFLYLFTNNIVAAKKISFKLILKNLYLLISPLLYCFQCSIRGGRFTIISMIIAFIAMVYVLVQYKNGWKYRLKVKSLIVVIAIIILTMIMFWGIKGLVGRTSQLDLFDYLSSYLGGSYTLYDSFIKHPPTKGFETFAGIVTSFSRNGIFNIDVRSSHEFRWFNSGTMLGNAYSADRNYYNDFGMFGVFFMNILYSTIFCIFYNKIKRIKINKHPFLLIVYSNLIYCVVFHFFTDYFFAGISIGFFVEIFVMYLLFYIVTKVRIIVH